MLDDPTVSCKQGGSPGAAARDSAPPWLRIQRGEFLLVRLLKNDKYLCIKEWSNWADGRACVCVLDNEDDDDDDNDDDNDDDDLRVL